MNKRNVGLFFVLVSLVLSSFNILFTGAVVGVGDVSLNLVAVVFFMVGVVLIFVSSTLESLVVAEDTVSPSEVIRKIEAIASGEDVTVVVDTSFLGAYSVEGVRSLMKGLRDDYGGGAVSDSVLGELRGPAKDLRNLVLKQSVMPVEGYEEYKGEARGYLEKSRKAFYYKNVIPIILGKKKAPESRHEAAPYVAAVKKLIGYTKGKPLNRNNLVAAANRHWKVSDVDVDVLAVAIAEARSGRKVIIAERDVDFEDAVDLVREADPIFGSLIHYVNCYGEAA